MMIYFEKSGGVLVKSSLGKKWGRFDLLPNCQVRVSYLYSKIVQSETGITKRFNIFKLRAFTDPCTIGVFAVMS